MEYVMLGETAGVKGVDLIGRHKNVYEELYDVWVVERPTTRPGRLVFVNCSAASCSDYLYLISFDLPSRVVGPRAGARRPTREYSKIKEALLLRLCGRVDNSTYVCGEDCSEVPAELGARKLQVFRVVPANEGTRRAVAEAVLAARAYVTVAALSLAPHGRGVWKARRMLEVLSSIPRTAFESYERVLGVRVDVSEAVEALRKKLEREV
ncbi:MAG: hypothetical protein QXG48_03570 [Thermofilaceae archaeon]